VRIRGVTIGGGQHGRHPLMGWVALGLTAETAVFLLAGVAWFLSREYTLAEAGAGAVITVFMALSLIHQISLFTGSLLPGLILEPVALATVLFAGLRRLPKLFRRLKPAAILMGRETFSGGAIAAACTVMAGMVVVGWLKADPVSDGYPWHGLGSGGFGPLAGSDPIPPLNAAGLFFHTARFGLDPGACGFGLLAYMAVGLCTYALARRYAWPPMALTVTLLVLSMPRLVSLGRRPSAELVSTAAVAVALVLDLSPGGTAPTRGPALFPALHPVFYLRQCVEHRPGSGDGAAADGGHDSPARMADVAGTDDRQPAVWRTGPLARPWGLAQIPAFALNLTHAHPLLGMSVVFDNDGIIGAAANLVRYLFISVDPTETVQRMMVWLLGLDLNHLLMVVYNALVLPVFGHAGADAPFAPVFSGSGHMGFGPFALLLVLPAMIHALMRGPRRLKALSVAWMGYLYLAALVVAWQPGSLSVLTPLYAANGFVVAFSLPPWRLRRRGMRILQGAFVLLMAWSFTCGYCMKAV
jgi:hypothetical protein